MAAVHPQDTPMIKHFCSVKAQYPEALLLYRVGDFYETYMDDAVTASKVLGLVLTKRSNKGENDIQMAGFPHHALETYLTKLVQAGYKVAVCDQLEDPKLAKKLVKRGVTELVTPGIAFGEGMLSQKENNYLTGVSFEKDKCGAAFLDVSTGTFQIAQGSHEYITSLLSTLSPKEIVVPRALEKTARALLGEERFYSTVDDWAFVRDAAEVRLCRQFGVDSLKGFAVDVYPLGICAAGALIVYLEQTQHAGLKNIRSISRIDEDKTVWMDRFTVRNLELFQSASGDGEALINVIDRCCCPMGARELRRWLALPVMDIGELNSRYDVVEAFVRSDEVREGTRRILGEIGDMERILSRAATGKIVPREVLQLARGLACVAPLKEICRESPAVSTLLAPLSGCEPLVADIRRTLVPDPAAAIGKGDVIASGVNEELDKLRDMAHGGKAYLVEMQQRESTRTGIPSLKIGYNNVFGYYLEVRNIHKDKVPPEWVRKQTLVSAERYITAELKEYEEKILGAEERIYSIESEEFARLVSQIQACIPEIQANARIIARLDVLCGFADLATTNRYCRPLMNEGTVLDIEAGRHPVIETLMPPGEEYVPNNLHLDNKGQQIIILTGPNMAGKSALLRQTALIVLLAQIGSFVPAKSARIGYFDKIFTRVGATDNISRGESTFMVEMLETAMILHNLSPRSLVILDEIGRGTATYDGMSLARAIVEYIHEYGQGAKTLFATHYHELNDLEDSYPRVKNFHIEVKESGKQVIFLRTLAPGGSAHSFGIHVARLAGMPREVLASAEKTLASLEQGHGGEGIQLSLFQLDDPTLSSMRDTLSAVDINNLTPLQAFDLIRQMKKELGI